MSFHPQDDPAEARQRDPAAAEQLPPRTPAEIASEIRAQVSRAVVGQDEVIRQLLVGLIAAGHVLLEGVPGLGKTLLARAMARAIRATTQRIQFTPDLMPGDVVGHVVYDMRSGRFEVRRGPVFTNILLADEINRAPAKTQAALLEVMQEQQVTLEGEALEVPRPFLVLATQNPLEQEGTYPLPEAQLDRFLLNVKIDYPDESDETRLLMQVTEGCVGDGLDLDAVGEVVDTDGVLALQRVAAGLRVDPEVAGYAVRLGRATRDWPGVAMGAGPRGAIALVRCARAWALLEGRDHVLPDDIREVALPALRHRIWRTPDVEIEDRRVDDLLRAVLDSVEAPRA